MTFGIEDLIVLKKALEAKILDLSDPRMPPERYLTFMHSIGNVRISAHAHRALEVLDNSKDLVTMNQALENVNLAIIEDSKKPAPEPPKQQEPEKPKPMDDHEIRFSLLELD